MSEKQRHSHEHAALKKPEEAQQPEYETTPSHDSNEREPQHVSPNVDTIRSQVEQHAAAAETFNAYENKTTGPEQRHHPLMLNKQLKDTAYTRTMIRVQKRLSLPNRYFSRVVHAPLIDKPAELAGKTIARPSGMLGGTFFALLSSSLMLWIARNYGYEYNFLVAILAFLGGLVFGLIIEGLFHLLRSSNGQ